MNLIYTEDSDALWDGAVSWVYDGFAEDYGWKDEDDVPFDIVAEEVDREIKEAWQYQVEPMLKDIFNNHLCLCIRGERKNDTIYVDDYFTIDGFKEFLRYFDRKKHVVEIFEDTEYKTLVFSLYHTCDIGLIQDESFMIMYITKAGEKYLYNNGYSYDTLEDIARNPKFIESPNLVNLDWLM